MSGRRILPPLDAVPEKDRNSPVWNCADSNYWWWPKRDRYPGTNDLLPGDVVLFMPLNPNVLERRIIAYQKAQYPLPEADFTHAAIFVGYDGLICEALPKGGVQCGHLDDKLDDCRILVRRVPSLPLDKRQAIARGAVFQRSTRYGWVELVQARFGHADAIRRLNGELEDEAIDALICSTLCSRALLRAKVSVLSGIRQFPPPLVTPALLATSPHLIDIELEWRSVPGCPPAA